MFSFRQLMKLKGKEASEFSAICRVACSVVVKVIIQDEQILAGKRMI
jgi:hypothetical protein